MTETIRNLMKNSGLPGPRGNLKLLYSFAKSATASGIEECFSFYRDDLRNSPEEFVVMCGIVGRCVLNGNDVGKALSAVRRYASHTSWRIREAVAIGIQEIAENAMDEILDNLEGWMDGNDLEKSAIVAALCEPKLLTQKTAIIRVLDLLNAIIIEFETTDGKLSEDRTSLRKALGYGWSVAVVALPAEGKRAFGKITVSGNRHIRWIVRENLKKNRMPGMGRNWVKGLLVDSD